MAESQHYHKFTEAIDAIVDGVFAIPADDRLTVGEIVGALEAAKYRVFKMADMESDDREDWQG